MHVINKRSFDIFLPYAGQRRGWTVKAGARSPSLPPDRFHDPVLQRDWKRGNIDVILEPEDKAVLGAVAANCTVIAPMSAPPPAPPAPQVPKAVPFVRPKAVKSGSEKLADEKLASARTDEAVKSAAVEAVTEVHAETKEAPKAPADAAIEAAVAKESVDGVLPKAPVVLHCINPDCAHPTANVKRDDVTGLPMCRYCRSYAVRMRKHGKEVPFINAVVTDDTETVGDDVPDIGKLLDMNRKLAGVK